MTMQSRRGKESGIAGEAIIPGQLVTGNGTATDKYMLYDADKPAVPTGIALSTAGADGRCLVIVKGSANA